jgi:hypothetical protein
MTRHGTRAQVVTQAIVSTQADYKPYLEEDLINAVTISFDTFISLFFNLDLDAFRTRGLQLVNQSCGQPQPRYMQLVHAYAKSIPHETHRYLPFAKLVMSFYTNSPPVLCRNDPVIMAGSVAKRKPDLVFVSPRVATLGTRGGSEMPKGPEKELCHWVELWGFVEHKQQTEALAYSDICSTQNPAPSESNFTMLGLRTHSLHC